MAIAIVWEGEERGVYSSARGAIEPAQKLDNTSVQRFRLQKVGNKWKVMAIPDYVKGMPLDDGDGKYGPPTAEEAKKIFDKVKPKPPGNPKLWPEE